MGAQPEPIESQYERIQRQVDARFTCACGDTALRRRECSNGTVQFVRQCERCGKTGQPLPHGRLQLWERDQAGPVDLRIIDRWQEARQAYRAELVEAERQQQEAEWWRGYDAYLNSPEWRAKSRACLARDGYQCRAQMAGCHGRATQAHHLNYDHKFNEPLFDLVAVCESCHAQITEMDRARRGR